MDNVLEAKSVVSVSTRKLEDELFRIRKAIPELIEFREMLAPQDPRRQVVDLALASAEQAEGWLSEHVQ